MVGSQRFTCAFGSIFSHERQYILKAH